MDARPRPLPLDEVLAHEGFVRALARGALGRDDQVEDVVSETLWAAVQGGSRGGPIRGWLATVVRRRAADVHRRRARAAAREAVAARPDRVPATIDAVVLEETRRRLRAALLTLDPIHREALVLRYDEGLPPRAMAVQLGVPVETARSRVKRGLELLRARLDVEHEGDRRRWLAGLALLADRPPPPPESTRKVAAQRARWIPAAVASAAVVAGIAVGVAVVGHPIRHEEDPGPASVARADEDVHGPMADPSPAGDARADGPRPGLAVAPTRPAMDPAAVTGTGAFVGRVRRDGRPLAATLELRRVGEVTPEAIADGRDPIDRHAWFRALGAAKPAGLTTRSDAGGTYVFERVRPGVYEMRVLVEGSEPQAFPLVLLHDGERRETLLECPDGPATLVVEAHVSDGTPASGAVAIASGAGWAWARGDLPRRLDAQGRVRFEGLPEGETTVFAWVDGEPTPREARLELPTSETLLLPPVAAPSTKAGGRLTGRVVEATSHAPVAGVRVHATRARPTADPLAYPLRSASTDAAGRFEIEGLGVGYVTAFVQGGGYRSVGLETIRDDAPDPLAKRTDETGRLEVEIPVVGAPPLLGLVVDEEGKPLAGATVQLDDFDPPRRGPGRGPGTPQIGALNAAVVSISDDEGRFALAAPIPGHPYTVSAIAAGRRGASTGLLRGPTDAEAPVRLTLPLEEGDAWSDVVVVDATSKVPVPFALVVVWRSSGQGSQQRLGAFRAGRDGGVRVGPFRSLDGLRASAQRAAGPREGFTPPFEPVPLLPTGTTIERPSPLLTLAVLVQVPPGEDACKVDLYVSGPGIETSLLIRGATDPDGRYEIGVPGRGPFHLYGILGANDRIEGRTTGYADAGTVRLVLQAAPPK